MYSFAGTYSLGSCTGCADYFSFTPCFVLSCQGIKARNYLLEKIEECIREKEGRGTVGDFTDALDLIMNTEDGEERMSRREVKESALELLFAGHETTASAACSMILHLAKNPDVVENVTHELAAHGLLRQDALSLDLVVLNKLTYTSNVVKEVLRILPPVGAGFRKALKTFEIEVGTT